MRATISILTYTQLELAKQCIASVLNGGGDFDLILTANGNAEAARYFRDLSVRCPGVRVIENEHNLGFIEPNKTALAMTETPLFLMLNDDCVVPMGWLDKIVDEFNRHPTAAVVGPIGRRLRDSFVGGLPCSPDQPPEYIEGCCLAIRTELAKKHGLFDPNLQFAYTEDAELCLRMQQLGHTIHVARFPLIHHGGTTSRHVPEAGIHFQMNHSYCRNKWAAYLKSRTFN